MYRMPLTALNYFTAVTNHDAGSGVQLSFEGPTPRSSSVEGGMYDAHVSMTGPEASALGERLLGSGTAVEAEPEVLLRVAAWALNQLEMIAYSRAIRGRATATPEVKRMVSAFAGGRGRWEVTTT